MAATDQPLSAILEDLLGPDLPIAIRAYDGSRLGPPEDEAGATIVVRSPDALRRIVTAPGELGFGRAYVAGDLEVEGDIYEALKLGDALPHFKLNPKQWSALVKLIGVEGLKPLPPPPEEAHLRGRRHSKERDAAAIQHHYDVSNEFYEHGARLDDDVLVRGLREAERSARPRPRAEVRAHLPQARPAAGPAAARRRVRLGRDGDARGQPPRRAGGRHHDLAVAGREGARARGGRRARRPRRHPPARLPRRRRRPLRRDQLDRHVRARGLGEARRVLRAAPRAGRARRPGAEPRHQPSLERRAPRASGARPSSTATCSPTASCTRSARSCRRCSSTASRCGTSKACASTTRSRLRHWVANLEANWDEAVRQVGLGRAKVWRLYMAASALNFEKGGNQIHQVLAVRPDGGASHMPLRPDWGA